ncbi:UPF0454 protein [Galdieria sulphuraria]|nr:UPF0454 protein [Galdieria sulphuraria]
MVCRNTKIGPFRITDDYGYTCWVNQSLRGCCFWKPLHSQPYSCHDCDGSVRCCHSFEYCVACCMGTTKTLAQSNNQHSSVDPFAVCLQTCRISSKHLLHENTYSSNWTYCFGTEIPQSPPSPKFWFMSKR